LLLFRYSFTHFSLISLLQYATQYQHMLHRVVFPRKMRYAFLVFVVELSLVDRHPQCTHRHCRIVLTEPGKLGELISPRCNDYAAKSLAGGCPQPFNSGVARSQGEQVKYVMGD
jgi:hypothetical protein